MQRRNDDVAQCIPKKMRKTKTAQCMCEVARITDEMINIYAALASG
ncbi:hypothetical protein CKO_04740 [Citrobacter koseri ATCC BAA-895]|uniref:Uncharacterized protein n=1 Tax=Citrobacter koseri (strain ATCC BAA-895 / CDC 4225-83 / SGSC4696) TaxID=290338 RepID=A8AQM2_CITK8|nr:hypothetical protein CKO_04740 [Citrobacter koseri ATCC BAA-895]